MSHKNNQRGFTIFELMVTLILVGIMISGAFFIYRHFMDSLDQEFTQVEMQRQGAYALGVMEARIRHGNPYEIGNYGGGIDNKLPVTVPVVTTATGSVAAKDIEYYQDGNTIIEKSEQQIIIVPDTHFEGIEVKELKFTTVDTDETGNGILVNIDLMLQYTHREGNEELCGLTGGGRMRNAGR